MSTIIELNPQDFARTQQGSCLMTATDTETGIKEPIALFEGRASGRTAVGRDGLIYDVLPYEPAFTLVDGRMVLSEEPLATNTIINSRPSSEDIADLNINYEQKNIYFFGGDTNVFTFSENTFGYRYSGTPFINQDNAYSFYVIMNDGSEPIVADNSAEGDFSIRYAYTGAETIPLANIEKEHLGNGLWRIKSVYNIPSGAAALGVVSSSTNRGFSCTQIDLVQASEVTSPIETNGATATRLGATGVKTPDISKWINYSSGKVSFEVNCKSIIANGVRRVTLGTDVNSNGIGFLFLNENTSQAFIRFRNNDVTLINDLAFPVDLTKFNSFKVELSDGKVEIFVEEDSVQVFTPAFNLSDLDFDKIILDRGNGASSDQFYGDIKQIKITS